MPTIFPIETASLGDRSYFVHDGHVAFVVDPQRDIDRVLDLAERENVKIAAVFETHIHNDYVTGGLGLAQQTGAAYYVNAADQVSFDRTPIHDDETVTAALTLSEGDYVEQILAGLEEFPAYYAHMGPANAGGPGIPDMTAPETADVAELRRRLDAGEWLVDLRSRTAFAAGHAPGTYNFGLDGQFSTYLGWLIPWGTPVTLLGESPEQIEEAQRELIRIGIDRPAAAATGGPEKWTDVEVASFPRATFADLAQVRHHRDVAVLDVRRAAEHESAHIDGSVNVPIHDIFNNLSQVPAGEVWVHCAGGYRASVVASNLAAKGHQVVAVDESFDQAAQVGLPVMGN